MSETSGFPPGSILDTLSGIVPETSGFLDFRIFPRFWHSRVVSETSGFRDFRIALLIMIFHIIRASNCTHVSNVKKSCVRGLIAQWLEWLTADQQVPGSNPG